MTAEDCPDKYWKFKPILLRSIEFSKNHVASFTSSEEIKENSFLVEDINATSLFLQDLIDKMSYEPNPENLYHLSEIVIAHKDTLQKILLHYIDFLEKSTKSVVENISIPLDLEATNAELNLAKNAEEELFQKSSN